MAGKLKPTAGELKHADPTRPPGVFARLYAALATALLETRGARSGAARRNAIIYFHDGERVAIVASNAGAPRDPAWYHNVRAHPGVVFGGIPMHATVVDDEGERDRLWALADRVFPAFAKYRKQAARTGRTIPIMQLVARPR
jgi:deazaflavin-dependent oxidoreductase (nitroreductase family)